MMSEHQESVLKYIPANLRRYFTSLRFFLSSEKDGGFPILAYRWRSPAGKPPFVSGCQKIVKMKTSALIGSGKTSRDDSELPLTLFLNQIKKKEQLFAPPILQCNWHAKSPPRVTKRFISVAFEFLCTFKICQFDLHNTFMNCSHIQVEKVCFSMDENRKSQLVGCVWIVWRIPTAFLQLNNGDW